MEHAKEKWERKEVRKKTFGLGGEEEGEKEREIPLVGMTFCIFQEVSGV